MNAIIRFWGNSLAVRIPTNLAREARLEESSTVDISVNNGTLMVVPIETSPTYRLDDLIAGITDENRHVEIGTGSAKGNEFC